MTDIIQKTRVKNKVFTIKDNSNENSNHFHKSEDITSGAVAVLNGKKDNELTRANVRQNLGITTYQQGVPDPYFAEEGDIHLQKRTGPMAVTEGGTGCVTDFDVRQNFNLIGVDLISKQEDDIPLNWANIGTGVVYIQHNDYLNEQPSSSGFLHNQVYGDMVYQIWYAMGGLGEVYVRSGTISGWDSMKNGWIKMHNQNTINKKLYGSELAEGKTAEIGNELLDYTIFRFCLKGKGTNVLCMRDGEYVRGIGGYSDKTGSTGSATTYHVNCSIVDETSLNCIACNQITHQFESEYSHDYYQTDVIEAIYGII